MQKDKWPKTCFLEVQRSVMVMSTRTAKGNLNSEDLELSAYGI
jgi:hypothetical protein